MPFGPPPPLVGGGPPPGPVLHEPHFGQHGGGGPGGGGGGPTSAISVPALTPFPQTALPSLSLTACHPTGMACVRTSMYPLASSSSAVLLSHSSSPKVGSFIKYRSFCFAT